jgi:hypothetical protein
MNGLQTVSRVELPHFIEEKTEVLRDSDMTRATLQGSGQARFGSLISESLFLPLLLSPKQGVSSL